MRPFTLAVLVSLSSIASAECMKYVPPANAEPDLDGPGSFGPLHNTRSLDCLSIVSISEAEQTAVVKDEEGKLFPIKVGHYLGTDNGRVMGFTRDSIILHQVVPNGTDWKEETFHFKAQK